MCFEERFFVHFCYYKLCGIDHEKPVQVNVCFCLYWITHVIAMSYLLIGEHHLYSPRKCPSCRRRCWHKAINTWFGCTTSIRSSKLCAIVCFCFVLFFFFSFFGWRGADLDIPSMKSSFSQFTLITLFLKFLLICQRIYSSN